MSGNPKISSLACASACLLAAVVASNLLTMTTAASQAPAKPAADAARRTTKGATPTPLARAARTPWGAPDLQGVWTSDDARSVPMQRPPEFAGRDLLTDAEFAERTKRDDETRSDTKNAAGTFVGEVGTRTFRQTSLVVEPTDGRIPPSTFRGAAENSRHSRGKKPVATVVGGSQYQRQMHHSRRCRDHAWPVRQWYSDRAESGLCRDQLRDDSRDSLDPLEQPSAPRPSRPTVHG